MECGSRSCRVMLNYRLISVSEKLCTFSLEIMLNHLNVICDIGAMSWRNLSVSICRMCESGLLIRLAHAQCSVITEDGEQGFSKTGPIF